MIYFKMISYTEPFKEMDITYPVTFGVTLDLDGEIMYENTHFTDKSKAIDCQKVIFLLVLKVVRHLFKRLKKLLTNLKAKKTGIMSITPKS